MTMYHVMGILLVVLGIAVYGFFSARSWHRYHESVCRQNRMYAKRIDELSKDKEASDALITDQTKMLGDQNKRLVGYKNELSSMRHRLTALVHIREEFSYYSQVVREMHPATDKMAADAVEEMKKRTAAHSGGTTAAQGEDSITSPVGSEKPDLNNGQE